MTANTKVARRGRSGDTFTGTETPADMDHRSRGAYDGAPRDTAASRRRRAALQEAGPPPESALLTVDQLCAELHISRSTFYDWRAKGKAPECIILPNGSLRVQRDDLAEWLRSRRAA
jgi:predicted DNA-binding transcriptional regulator AlpA